MSQITSTVNRGYMIIDFCIIRTFMQKRSQQGGDNTGEVKKKLQRMDEIISSINWQMTTVLRGDFSMTCASYQTAEIIAC